MKIAINNLDDLRKFAVDFALRLRGGDVVGLIGDLGAGKTTFVQFLAAALGVQEEVKSPTFVLVREYIATEPTAFERNIRKLVHADAYRLEDEDELWAIGFADLVDDAETVTVVEWADRLPALKDRSTYHELRFEFDIGEKRIIDSSER
ncbi:tRNA (adenosine(37)-N6)-threonylcarbamoyltransferase complex ATPase subunit type 1 TsaE [Patescibacteria group bacterium]|nr:tRNA (adenosine(37)-N6)-threonylcarbamoyltransferase complex ATPase subunit type 1 TsaE [Patescibacteria group bacterium]MBU1028577.1 tRNA (adenosine(37)-N6)-threonylcarbamoyltransferase complex ATPase subunit type 1 TsaE [Patescibacteria group bacterium]MBU1915923.1 tRNA (adenosine(37)-N6)-threonylcarbamoyltransferase complex ATPase subunit type 1 TsaE [Patescibacteria group bacterium]